MQWLAAEQLDEWRLATEGRRLLALYQQVQSL